MVGEHQVEHHVAIRRRPHADIRRLLVHGRVEHGERGGACAQLDVEREESQRERDRVGHERVRVERSAACRASQELVRVQVGLFGELEERRRVASIRRALFGQSTETVLYGVLRTKSAHAHRLATPRDSHRRATNRSKSILQVEN